MTAFLEPVLTTIALCWRLERRDGVAIGFTTHDRDLTIDGLTYRAAPGILPSAIALGDGFDDGGGLDVAGALTSAAITGDDLAAGRWDGAAVFLFACDWESGGATLPLARGEIGDVTVKGGGFEAALRGPAAQLERAVVEQTSPDCRAELGDRRCRVDMAPRTRLARVLAQDEAAVELDADTGAADAFACGRLRWLTGANSGLEAAIVGSQGAHLTLREAPVYPAAAGDLVEIAEGCDKLFATCTGRFANGLNFRGEPHLPGMDLLTRYPGAS